MTRFTHPFRFPPGFERTARYVLAARVLVTFERVWPRLWPASGLVGIFLALALFGLPPLLPWPLHALVLACFVTAIGLALYFGLDGFVPATWRDGARRLERDSALQNRPLSEADDILAVGAGDPLAEELWDAHLKDRLRHMGPLRLGLPHPGLSVRDPRRLRFFVLGVVLVGLIVSWGHWGDRLAAAFGPGGYAPPAVDAWIDPPAYTDVAPVYLSADMRRVSVPAGSVLHVRVHGSDRAPFLSLQSTHFPFFPLGGVRFSGAAGEHVVRQTLSHDAHVRVRALGRTVGSWIVDVIPDRAPGIRMTAPPGVGERATLKLSFAAQDDYGVTAVRARITPADGHGPELVVDLACPPGKTVAETVYRDLTAHPYAGLDVAIVLEAEDAAGQKTQTAPIRFRLPQLVFTDPFARAMIELRRMLAQNGFEARARVMRTLDGLSIAPERFYEAQLGLYLGLRNGFWALKLAKTGADIDRVETLFWQMAIGVENGGLMPLAETLRAIQQELARQMADGAPQEQIDALLQRYADAMQRYLQALHQAPDGGSAQSDPAAKTLAPKDLDDLLAAIQTLSQSGDREKAQQLLAFLQGLIENMRVSSAPGGAGGAPPDNPALRDLSDLTGRQRQLLDKTFRQAQGAEKYPGGKMGLSREQGALKDALSALLKGQKKPPQALEKAERLMDESQKALAMGDLLRAGTLQKYALEAMRQAASVMTQGRGGAGHGGTDPFGRAGGSGSESKPIPDADVLKRARDILMELRKKAGETGRPKEERDYIERLLKQF